MATIIGLNFGYLVSFNHAAYTIYYYLTVLVIVDQRFDWSTEGV
jgi:hypothetical protein